MKRNIPKTIWIGIGLILITLLFMVLFFIGFKELNSLKIENTTLKHQLEKRNFELQNKDNDISKIDFLKTDLEEEVMEQKNKIELLEKNLQLLNEYNFNELKLISKIDNPYNGNKNIYIYANSHARHLNSISEVTNCGWRYSDAYGCHIFVGNNTYKKLILSNTGFTPGKFINENTIEYYNGFSDGGGSATNTIQLNILDGSYERTGTGSNGEVIDTWYLTGVLDEFIKCDIRELDARKDDFGNCLKSY